MTSTLRAWTWAAKALLIAGGIAFAIALSVVSSLGDCVSDSGEIGECSTAGADFVGFAVFGFFTLTGVVRRGAPQWLAWATYPLASLAVVVGGLMVAMATISESVPFAAAVLALTAFIAGGLVVALRTHPGSRSLGPTRKPKANVSPSNESRPMG